MHFFLHFIYVFIHLFLCVYVCTFVRVREQFVGVRSFHHAYSGLVASLVFFFSPPQNHLPGLIVVLNRFVISIYYLLNVPGEMGPSHLSLYGNAYLPLFSTQILLDLIDTSCVSLLSEGGEYFACMCVCMCVCLVPEESRRGCRSPWNWSYGEL